MESNWTYLGDRYYREEEKTITVWLSHFFKGNSNTGSTSILLWVTKPDHSTVGTWNSKTGNAADLIQTAAELLREETKSSD